MIHVHEPTPHSTDMYATVHRTMVLTHFALSTAILVGGPRRFPPPTYQPLLDLTGGTVWPWGVTIGVSALLMATNIPKFDIPGMLIGIFWMSMFSAMFIVSLRYPTSGSTAYLAYLAFAILNTALFTQRLKDVAKVAGSVKEM